MRKNKIFKIGILLKGFPGCGKTLVVKQIARMCNASLFLINGPEIMCKYVGESEGTLRDIFDEAERMSLVKKTPSIVFIDEIDCVAGKRDKLENGFEVRFVS